MVCLRFTYRCVFGSALAAPLVPVAAPLVTIKDGKVVANSRDVADFFGKRHDNVLRDIVDRLLKSEDTPKDWFMEAPWFTRVTPTGGCVHSKTYDMTRDGFTLLVMGYTGPKAMEFKVRYIQQFNAMEEALRNQAPAQAALPTSYKEALVALVAAEEVKERLIAANEQKAKVITDMTPKENAWEALVAADGCICSADLGPP